MRFNDHSKLAGLHAFLSASNYHWINYTDEKLEHRWTAAMAAARGTALHKFAHDAIGLGIKLPANGNTVNSYVNDGIGYKMQCEQVFFYSDNCFGTADTAIFKRNKLRVHDLKTGIAPTSVHQLEVYGALFCLEYRIKPFDIEMEFRIYQSKEVQVFEGDPDVITHIMDRIIVFDKRINELKEEALS